MSKPENSVEHVLDRMVEAVLGKGAYFKSHEQALGIPRNTIKSWKRRGEVPEDSLKGFAYDWKVSFEWLLHGGRQDAQQSEVHQVNQNVAPYGLKPDEAALLDNYRHSSEEAQAALRATSAALAQCDKPTKCKGGK